MRGNRPVQQALRLTCTLSLFALIALQSVSQAQTRRFLPAAGFNTGASTNNQYGGNLANFDQPVLDNGFNVGTIQFDYDTYGGTPTGAGAFTGGGALAGKFVAAGDARLPAGVSIVWAQTVIATISGNNEWAAANNTEFPDTNNGKTSPAYPFQTLPGGAAATQPSANFQDFPNRFTTSGNQSWLGELSLMCVNNTTHTANVIETFLWGFGVQNATPGALTDITANTPHLWGAPTASFLATERASFNGLGGSTAWTFNTSSSFLTPEPGVYALFGAGLCAFTGCGFRRIRRSKKAKAA